MKSVSIYTKLESVRKLENTLDHLGIEPCLLRLESGNLNTLPIDVYGCTVANKVLKYLSKIVMELNVIVIELYAIVQVLKFKLPMVT